MSLTENNLLVVDQDDAFLDEAKRLFEGGLPVARSLDEAREGIESGLVRMVILGPSFGTDAALEDARSLRILDPTLISLHVSNEVTANLLRSAMRVGISDVIEAPLTEDKIKTAIEQFSTEVLRPRVSSTERTETAEPDHGKVITVASAKGGAGKTITATNLAVLLARLPDTTVCLVDADLQFGDVCLVLQIEPSFTVVNAAAELHKLDSQLLDSILATHHSGLRVLPAPLEPAFADDITTPALLQIISLLSEMFDYVVIDTASIMDELLLSLFERSDEIVMVVDMDLPAVKNSKLALETLRLLKFPTSKIRLLLNRSNAKVKLDEREIEEALKTKISARIPSDAIVAASVNEGRPVVESSPRSRVAKGFEESVEVLVGREVPTPTKGFLGRR